MDMAATCSWISLSLGAENELTPAHARRRGPGGPIATWASLSALWRSPHGLESSKRIGLLDIGINRSCYLRQTPPGRPANRRSGSEDDRRGVRQDQRRAWRGVQLRARRAAQRDSPGR